MGASLKGKGRYHNFLIPHRRSLKHPIVLYLFLALPFGFGVGGSSISILHKCWRRPRNCCILVDLVNRGGGCWPSTLDVLVVSIVTYSLYHILLLYLWANGV